MKWISKIKKEGVSLKQINYIVLIFYLVITAVLLGSVFYTFRAYYSYSASTDKFIDLEEAAERLMNASDYLTEEARSYTVTQEREHLDNYFRESEVDRNRENAIAEMESKVPSSEALANISKAMERSVQLMDREYYSMLLVLSATGDTDIPEAISKIELTPEDEALSGSDKIILAQKMMHDEEYAGQKDQIYNSLEDCIKSLENESLNVHSSMRKSLLTSIIWMSILIIIQSGGLVTILLLTSRLGIRPLLRAVDYISHDDEIPIDGAREFRYMANAYNKMFSVYSRSMKKLSFKAYHDELTGLYNRTGYDLITQSLDVENTAFLLIDSDKFKEINDNNGHDIGDRVLRRIADTLKSNFRPADYVFRIGGDEFVVIMTQISSDIRELITEKVNNINQSLANTPDDLPPMSVSVGIAMYEEGINLSTMYKRADEALYTVKENGRSGCSFYESNQGL